MEKENTRLRSRTNPKYNVTMDEPKKESKRGKTTGKRISQKCFFSTTFVNSQPIPSSSPKSHKSSKDKKIHEIVEFSLNKSGDFEYMGQLDGKTKCFNRKAILSNNRLFAEVMKFYEKKLQTFFDNENKRMQKLE